MLCSELVDSTYILPKSYMLIIYNKIYTHNELLIYNENF